LQLFAPSFATSLSGFCLLAIIQNPLGVAALAFTLLVVLAVLPHFVGVVAEEEAALAGVLHAAIRTTLRVVFANGSERKGN